MTATVTPPHIVDKFDDLAPMSGDNLTRLTYGLLDIRKPAGQLWERVAERVLNYDVYPWRALDAVERFHDDPGRPVCIAATGYKRILGRHVCGDHHSHGIIRAGERVK